MKKNMQFSPTVIVFAVITVLILTNVSAATRGVYSKNHEKGKIRFYFDDNTPIQQGVIEIFDSSGTQIATGTTDNNGIFNDSQYKKATKITAADQHGHHGERKPIKLSHTSRDDTTEFYIVVLITLILIGITVGYSLWNYRKKKK
ncbi:MAG: hypothetical protein LBJ67_11405 [Planctomycetaceae bacterium]|jgi:hypothetical protein|nr:hypothetical protein [Planctomycetaceae bacterium]